MKKTFSIALILMTGILSPVAQATMGMSRNQNQLSTQSFLPGSAHADDVQVMGDYEDCTVTYDACKGQSLSSGTNTITFRTSASTWTVTYDFNTSGGNYLMSGGGNLEGKSINVRFDGGRPASLKSNYGSGSCRVNSARRN